MSKDFDKLPLVVGGKTVIFPCMEIMALSTIPKAEGATGYTRFYDAFARRYGGQLKYYRLSDSTKWKKVEPKDLRKVPGWFSDASSLAAPLLGIVMHTHEVAADPQAPLFEMMFDHVFPQYPRGMFRIVLPLDTMGKDVAMLLELIDDAMAEFPVHWGTAGYAFYWKGTDITIDEYADQWIGRHLAKHPGLSTGDLLTWGARVELGVANVGWLTFVGDTLVDRLGGRKALAAAAEGAGVKLRSYAKGVALQAAPIPELGNVNRKQDLAGHREVGRMLEPVFAPVEVLQEIDVKGYDDDDEMLEWLRRFLP